MIEKGGRSNSSAGPHLASCRQKDISSRGMLGPHLPAALKSNNTAEISTLRRGSQNASRRRREFSGHVRLQKRQVWSQRSPGSLSVDELCTNQFQNERNEVMPLC